MASKNSKDFNYQLDRFFNKIKEKFKKMTTWKEGQLVEPVVEHKSFPAAAERAVVDPDHSTPEKQAFLDDAAKQIMACIHSGNALGQDVTSAARHAYLGAEALWTERQKQKK
jgi:hypothetical protein